MAGAALALAKGPDQHGEYLKFVVRCVRLCTQCVQRKQGVSKPADALAKGRR